MTNYMGGGDINIHRNDNGQIRDKKMTGKSDPYPLIPKVTLESLYSVLLQGLLQNPWVLQLLECYVSQGRANGLAGKSNRVVTFKN